MSKQDRIAAARRRTDPYPQLADIINRKRLDATVNRELVRAATHPTLPLWVYNYTSRTERAHAWDQVTVTCRGLVRDNKGRVIARPFQKFFGWGQKSASAVRAVRLSEPCTAFAKLDGTMLCASNFDGQLLLTTRGSFDDWRLDRARALWPAALLPAPGETWVLEYTGPENRIVTGYDIEQLWLLGVIDNWTGADLWERFAELEATGAFAAPHRFDSDLAPEQLAAAASGAGFEGWVCVWPRSKGPSGRLKVKNPAWLADWQARFREAAS